MKMQSGDVEWRCRVERLSGEVEWRSRVDFGKFF